jgi:hypothetical protein
MENLTKEQIVANILSEYKTTITLYLQKDSFWTKEELYSKANQMSTVLKCLGYSDEEEREVIREIRKELGL